MDVGLRQGRALSPLLFIAVLTIEVAAMFNVCIMYVCMYTCIYFIGRVNGVH